MKPGDEILIRAKLINVRERDNEATVGFDSTTTAVVPLGAVCEGAEPGLREALESVQWSSTDGIEAVCPRCGRSEREGHNQVCTIAAALARPNASSDSCKLWRISQAVKLQRQNDLAGLQQFYDYVKGVVGERETK